MKFQNWMSKWGTTVILVLVLLSYFKSCSVDSEVERIKKEQRILTNEIDTLSSQIVNEEEMIFLIKTVPAWKTLRIEEISDKERISINALEEKEDDVSDDFYAPDDKSNNTLTRKSGKASSRYRNKQKPRSGRRSNEVGTRARLKKRKLSLSRES